MTRILEILCSFGNHQKHKWEPISWHVFYGWPLKFTEQEHVTKCTA